MKQTTHPSPCFAWKRKLVVIAVTGLVALPALVGAQGGSMPGHSSDKAGASAAGNAANKTPADMGKAMESMNQKMSSMQMTGDTDHDFAMMMRAHHQGALDMAQVELANGKDPTMRSMAKKMIADQKKEIAQIDKWLAKKGKQGHGK